MTQLKNLACLNWRPSQLVRRITNDGSQRYERITEKNIHTVENTMDAWRLLLCLGLLTTVGGCTSSSLPGRPIVDMKGVNAAAYKADLTECNEYAKEVEAGKQVAIGAAAGAVVGGLLGASIGNAERSKRSAGAGATYGGARGGMRALNESNRVVRNCLRIRGYVVLN